MKWKEGERVGWFGGGGGVQGEFEFHGGLAFEMDLMAQADEGGYGVKEAPDAGGVRRVESAREHGLEQAEVGGREGVQRCQIGFGKGRLAVHFAKHAEGGPARLLHGRVAAGQAEGAKMGHAVNGGFRDEEEFAAPYRAVEAIAGTVPGDAEDGRLKFVLGHTGEHVGDVMLDGEELRWGGFAGSATRRSAR